MSTPKNRCVCYDYYYDCVKQQQQENGKKQDKWEQEQISLFTFYGVTYSGIVYFITVAQELVLIRFYYSIITDIDV